MLPLWSSYLVRVYSWKLILAKEGIISWFFAKLHLSWLLEAILAVPVIGGPALSISYLGMFLVFTYIWLPFMILPIQASLERVPNSLINASYDLGATKGQTFFKVILPLALPGIAAGSIFLVCSLCNQNITKKQVSKACKISEVTISKCYKKLYNERVKLFPKKAILKYNIKI